MRLNKNYRGLCLESPAWTWHYHLPNWPCIFSQTKREPKLGCGARPRLSHSLSRWLSRLDCNSRSIPTRALLTIGLQRKLVCITKRPNNGFINVFDDFIDASAHSKTSPKIFADAAVAGALVCARCAARSFTPRALKKLQTKRGRP